MARAACCNSRIGFGQLEDPEWLCPVRQWDPHRVTLGDRFGSLGRRAGSRVLDGNLLCSLELAEGLSSVVLEVNR